MDTLWGYIASTARLKERMKGAARSRALGLARRAARDAAFRPALRLARERKTETAFVLAGILIGARALLSGAARFAVNRALGRQGPVRGRVRGIHFSLSRGGVVVRGLRVWAALEKVGLHVEAPRIRAWWDWRALLRGRPVFWVEAEAPQIHMSVDASEETAPKAGKEEAAARPRVNPPRPAKGLFPFTLERLSIRNGFLRVTVRDGEEVPVFLQGVEIDVRRVTNRPAQEAGPASAEVRAAVMGKSWLEAKADGFPFDEKPSFRADAELEDLELAPFNPILRRFAGLDLESGRLRLTARVSSSGGELSGWVTPVLEDLDFFSFKREKAPGKFFKEGGLDLIAGLLENRRGRRIATTVRFSGQPGAIQVDKAGAVRTLLRNAFRRPSQE